VATQPEPPAGAPGSLQPAPGEPAPPLLPPDLDATIVLLRHGESQWITEGRFQGQGDSPLSPLGRRQAELAAARLAHPQLIPALPVPAGPPVAIHHSPLARTAVTAGLVAAAMASDDAFGVDVPLHPDRGFLEIGQGEWEGLPGATIVERWGLILDGWRTDPISAWAPGGESLPEVDLRVRASRASILAGLRAAAPTPDPARSQVLGYADRPGDEPWTLIVGHDGVFKVTLLALLDLALGRFWTFPFALCGITIVEIRRGRPRLRLHNAADHLAPLEDEAVRAREAEREAERRRLGAL
jgi:broad specificity phosphatase PhoE